MKKRHAILATIQAFLLGAAICLPATVRGQVTIEDFNNYTTGGNVFSFSDPAAVITPGPDSWTVDLTGATRSDYFGFHFDTLGGLDVSGQDTLALDFTVNQGGTSGTTAIVVLEDAGGTQNVYSSPGLGVGNHQFSIPLNTPTGGGGADLSNLSFFQVQANSFGPGGSSPYSITFNDLSATIANPGPAAVPKTNPMPVYMHYMPWFETPATQGPNQWGFHWKLNNQNPNIVDAEGRRQIAAHYYPLIGPYASSDPDVIEYHLLLMKYAGVDGVVVDWYGTQGTNGDINELLTNSNAIIDETDDVGLEFGVVFEDRFAANVGQSATNMAYLRDNYFNRSNYIRTGAGDDPLVMVFGPITWETEAEWNTILAQAGEPVDLLTLWNEAADVGANADGEFLWPFENEALDDYLTRMETYYRVRAQQFDTVGGVAYPGFDDFYVEGGVGQVVNFEIPHDNGQTLAAVFDLVEEYEAEMDFLQLATFNDFGEGTIFEPTVETGFDYLVQVQQYTGVPYTEDELQLIYRLFRARKEFEGDAAKQTILDQVFNELLQLDVSEAESLLDSIDPQGDFDGDGDADLGDLLQLQRQFGETGVYPLGTLAADANADSVVDNDDFIIWQNAAIAGTTVAAVSVVPEPASAQIVLLAAAAASRIRWGR